MLVVSGAASLILQTVWARSLRLVFGSTTLATSTVLVAFMVGLGIGGILGGRLVRARVPALRTYGLLELGIGMSALLVPLVLGLFPLLNHAVLADLAFGQATLARFFAVLVALAPSTVLMGATLPVVVSAWVPQGGSVRPLGILYAANTTGAVAGVLLSTVVMLGFAGVWGTNVIAAGMCCSVGALALYLASRSEGRRANDVSAAGPPEPRRAHRWTLPLLSYGAVGFTALVYEVSWTRALTLVLGSSIYAFAAMLAAFLIGIATGSFVARDRVARWRHPERGYAVGIGLLGIFAYFTSVGFHWLPDMFLNIVVPLGLSETGVLTANLVVAAGAMLLPTVVLGALFPLLTRVHAANDSLGVAVGNVYFVNTLGGALGAFTAGFVFIPMLGLPETIALAVAVNMLLSGLLLASQAPQGRQRWYAALAGGALAGLVLLLPPYWDPQSMTRGLYRDPREAMDMGITLHPLRSVAEEEILYYRDGVSATVSVHRKAAETFLRVNGKGEATTGPEMDEQVLFGHVPMLFGPRVDSAMLVGLASGVTAGSAALHRPNRLDIVEIEPAIVAASRFFDEVNHRPLEQPFVHLVFDDARSYLAATPREYDVIISVPSNPWTSGSSSLFTRNFFADVRDRLRPGGRMLQWLELYGLDFEATAAILASMREVFPHLYGLASSVGSPSLIVLAMDRPLARSDLPDWSVLSESVRDDLRRVGIFSTAELWSLVRLLPEDIDRIVASAPAINTDDNLLIELRAPWTLYDATALDANWQRLGPVVPALRQVTEADARPLDSTALGELAVAYATLRNDEATARALLALGYERGNSAELAVAEAALIQMNQENRAAAVALLDAAITAEPDAFLPRLFRARLRMDGGDAIGSLEDANRALATQPGDLRARYVRMQALGVMGRADETRAEAEILLASPYARREPQLWAYAARAAAMLGRFDEAIDEMKRYLEWNPFSALEWPTLARMYEATGQSELAADAEWNGAQAARNRVLATHQLARRVEALGDRSEAIALLREVVLSDPSYAPARDDLRRLGAFEP